MFVQAEQAEDDDGEIEADLRAYMFLHPAAQPFHDQRTCELQTKQVPNDLDTRSMTCAGWQAEVDDDESEADLGAHVFLHPFHDQRTTNPLPSWSADMEGAVLREGANIGGKV